MNMMAAPASFGANMTRNWTQIVSRYKEPDVFRSVMEIAISAGPFAAFWVAAYLASSVSILLAGACMLVASGFLLRLFLIQHDCGHHAFFKSAQTNDWIGRALGVLTMTPYDVWRRSHAIHHAGSGNLDRRGTGDIYTLTVAEYRALSWWRKLRYQAYRHPLVMFGVGPAYVFLVMQRLPVGQMTRNGWRPWISAMGTNAAILACAVLVASQIGWGTFLAIHIPIVLIAATVGVWLFYVQHQFEETFWEETKDWSPEEAALLGSSYYDLPPVLSWFSANIGIHHIHHLSSRIPFYRLPQVLRDHPELANMRRITTLEGVRSLRLKLWDPEAKRLVSFRDATRAG
jgi:omega-6 fatty acid desaturase (delta-12 desaturase)